VKSNLDDRRVAERDGRHLERLFDVHAAARREPHLEVGEQHHEAGVVGTLEREQLPRPVLDLVDVPSALALAQAAVFEHHDVDALPNGGIVGNDIGAAPQL
jgi:hypothetical protein